MKRPILEALLLDAYYQVLDNRVFRMLAVLVVLLVLPTFVLGAREQGLVILFGVKTVPWRDLGWLVGGQNNPDVIVQRFQEAVVGGLAGTLGILFSIAATAFFVPRMLEKGAADVVFSRPIGRATLLAARYSAGVLFVGLLSAALVVGMHLGLLLVSGRSDPAFLWTILTIVYVFALVHSVSLLVGVLTRNAVAALLSTILFFALNGCVHNVWILSEYARQERVLQHEEQEAHADDVPAILYHTLDTLHFVLPKTTDADLIVHKLRRAIVEDEPLLRDEATGVSLAELPQGLGPDGRLGTRDLAREPARWTSAAGELVLRREARLLDGKRRNARGTAREFSTALEQRGVQPGPALASEPGRAPRFEFVSWKETLDGQEKSCTTGFCALGDWLLVLEVRERASADSPDGAGLRAQSFARQLHLDQDDPRGMDPAHWYARRLDWGAPPRHNIFVSVSSSLLFALVLFALAAWRLSRIDF